MVEGYVLCFVLGVIVGALIERARLGRHHQ